MIRISNLTAGYGPITVIRDLSLEMGKGQVFSLVGANGVGKTTTLRAISGLIRPTSGSIEFEGKPIHGMSPEAIVRAGIAHVPEGRHIFPDLTVLENLEMGCFIHPREFPELSAYVFELFPVLEDRVSQLAGTLSGGEQQMLAIGRALMTKPRLLLLDEPSWGLAPKMVELVFETIARLKREGLTVLLVEQHLHKALEISDYAAVMVNGRIAFTGEAKAVLADDRTRKAYLGVSD